MDNENKPLDTENEEQKKESDGADTGEDTGADDIEDTPDEGGGDEDIPITAKQFAEFQRDISNKLSMLQRHSLNKSKNYKPTDKNIEKDSLDVRRIDRLEEIDRKRSFGYEYNLSPQEVDLVFQFSKKPNAKTLEHPFVQGGLEKLRQTKRVQDNIPRGGGAKTFSVGDKSFNDLKPEDKKANFTEYRKSLLNK